MTISKLKKFYKNVLVIKHVYLWMNSIKMSLIVKMIREHSQSAIEKSIKDKKINRAKLTILNLTKKDKDQ